MFFCAPPKMANNEPITPERKPTERANLRPPRAVKRASGRANAAAPSTDDVCASPAKLSESVIEATSNEPAATVPATPTPLRTWAVARTFTVFSCSLVFGIYLVRIQTAVSVGNLFPDKAPLETKTSEPAGNS